MNHTHLVLASLTLSAACTTSDAPIEDHERDGVSDTKADDDNDLCAVHGWYGDSICDLNCAAPDPDCANALVIRAQHNNSSVIVTQGQRVMIQLAAWIPDGWHVTADRTLGQPASLWAPNIEQLTWDTSSLALFEPNGGVHTVDLEYIRPENPTLVLGRFSVTLDVRPTSP